MVTGGGAMHLDDGLGHQPGLHCYFNHHEQACAIAAEAYARIHNKIAALCVTTGPGGTNAITGVVGGWLDSIPMLVLSGQVRYDTTAHSTGLGIRAMGDQEFEITKAIDCMTKYSEMVLDPMRIRFCLEKSLYLAQTGRPGPCWLDIPLNVQGAYIETEALLGFDKDDYEAGGTGWSGHGTGCSGCTICMMNKVEGKPAMIPSDVGGYWFIKMNPYYSKEELESFEYKNAGNNIYEKDHIMRLRQAITNYWKEKFARFGKEIIYLEFEYPWQEGMNRLFVYQS